MTRIFFYAITDKMIDSLQKIPGGINHCSREDKTLFEINDSFIEKHKAEILQRKKQFAKLLCESFNGTIASFCRADGEYFLQFKTESRCFLIGREMPPELAESKDKVYHGLFVISEKSKTHQKSETPIIFRGEDIETSILTNIWIDLSENLEILVNDSFFEKYFNLTLAEIEN